MSPLSARAQGVAIAGASTLLGKELKQVLEDRNFPATDISLLDEDVAAGILTEAGGEPAFIQQVTADSFEKARFVFFTGSEKFTQAHYEKALSSGAIVIDLSGGLPANARSFGWIASLDRVLPPPSVSPAPAEKRALYTSPGSGVIIGATVAAALKDFQPTRVAILFLPPVSEAGQPGVDELVAQTTNLLSFRAIERSVFDSQVAFNLLPEFGEERKPSMHSIREGIAEGIAYYLADRTITPAVQLIQAPVFYGYSFAVYADFATAPSYLNMEAAFRTLEVHIQEKDEAAPDIISAAGQSEIQLARIEADPKVGSSVWLWGVADNLRLSATNAVRIAEELLVVPA
ncbi:MAG TPA: Asd/ArgC dimerization domain-containing protein [Candidatus Acidoferrales bacterium]